MTSENTQCSSRSGFRIFKISREIRVLKQSQSALFNSITDMTILFEFTCVMNVGDQARLSFVTRIGPFVIVRASLFTDHGISGRRIRAKFLSISEQFESILVTIFLQISILPL